MLRFTFCLVYTQGVKKYSPYQIGYTPLYPRVFAGIFIQDYNEIMSNGGHLSIRDLRILPKDPQTLSSKNISRVP